MVEDAPQKPDHILIVDDDRALRERIAAYLQANGMRVTHAARARDLRALLNRVEPDLVVLDTHLPDADGLALCGELRANRRFHALPILLLSTRQGVEDRIVGLEMGADDYLAKPLAIRELFMRIRAILRRARLPPPGLRVAPTPRVLRFGDWRLDTLARHLVDAGGETVALSSAEYRLLRVLLDYPNRVLSRDQLLDLTQGREADLLDRSIDLLVSRVRQRLRDGVREGRYIKTIRNEGYLFSATVTQAGGPRETVCCDVA
ncbi:DNA-binding dual transcriptional regulator OmpR [Paraburkholderia tropica]|uniref:response regulator n=1 Tax=Paraburkholderia tropica TaxID=92647 RepID=UPI001CB32F1E|nr:response regulator transcription factor [Paraburkholderia tropica]CAG9221615.1 DNA-binding dual transcriptional regulator OmpR [Paraburkholderia tropica]